MVYSYTSFTKHDITFIETQVLTDESISLLINKMMDLKSTTTTNACFNINENIDNKYVAAWLLTVALKMSRRVTIISLKENYEVRIL